MPVVAAVLLKLDSDEAYSPRGTSKSFAMLTPEPQEASVPFRLPFTCRLKFCPLGKGQFLATGRATTTLQNDLMSGHNKQSNTNQRVTIPVTI